MIGRTRRTSGTGDTAGHHRMGETSVRQARNALDTLKNSSRPTTQTETSQNATDVLTQCGTHNPQIPRHTQHTGTQSNQGHLSCLKEAQAILLCVRTHLREVALQLQRGQAQVRLPREVPHWIHRLSPPVHRLPEVHELLGVELLPLALHLEERVHQAVRVGGREISPLFGACFRPAARTHKNEKERRETCLVFCAKKRSRYYCVFLHVLTNDKMTKHKGAQQVVTI